jgi:hypothetical protein
MAPVPPFVFVSVELDRRRNNAYVVVQSVFITINDNEGIRILKLKEFEEFMYLHTVNLPTFFE